MYDTLLTQLPSPQGAVGKHYGGNTAEDIFQRQWAVALKEFRQPRAPLSDLDLWDLFNPFYPCPLMERVGDILDGGKFKCCTTSTTTHLVRHWAQ